MLKIAITGNIAGGKTAVENILRSKGYQVLDTDIVGHKLLKNNPQVIEAFKNEDIFEDGEISREKLGRLVFSDNEKLSVLNSILHPQIRKEIQKFFEDNISVEKVFVSIPLLFESGMQDLFDKIIFVYAHDHIRLQRLMARNKYDKAYALQRINAQIPQEEKLKKCDIVIQNNGTLDDLARQVELSCL